PVGSVHSVPRPELECTLWLSSPRIVRDAQSNLVISMKDEMLWTDVLRAAFIADLPFPLRFIGPRLQMGMNKPDKVITGSTLRDYPRAEYETIIVDTKYR